MGGMGFIETHRAECMLSVLISTHLVMAAREASVERFFYSSSACVYAAEKQTSAYVVPLRESDAYPAMPEDGYGWRACKNAFAEDGGPTSAVRLRQGLRADPGTQARIACSSGPTPMIAITRLML
jgi:GDP-D-mannose 3',5'-epimerase